MLNFVHKIPHWYNVIISCVQSGHEHRKIVGLRSTVDKIDHLVENTEYKLLGISNITRVFSLNTWFYYSNCKRFSHWDVSVVWRWASLRTRVSSGADGCLSRWWVSRSVPWSPELCVCEKEKNKMVTNIWSKSIFILAPNSSKNNVSVWSSGIMTCRDFSIPPEMHSSLESNVTSNDHPFGCPIIYTDTNYQ